jgi:hypothetical protein
MVVSATVTAKGTELMPVEAERCRTAMRIGSPRKFGRPVDAVEDAILRRRGQHFEGDIGNVDLQHAVLRHHDALGDGERRAGEHAVGDRVRRLHRLAVGIGKGDDADHRRRDEQPEQQAPAER